MRDPTPRRRRETPESPPKEYKDNSQFAEVAASIITAAEADASSGETVALWKEDPYVLYRVSEFVAMVKGLARMIERDKDPPSAALDRLIAAFTRFADVDGNSPNKEAYLYMMADTTDAMDEYGRGTLNKRLRYYRSDGWPQ